MAQGLGQLVTLRVALISYCPQTPGETGHVHYMKVLSFAQGAKEESAQPQGTPGVGCSGHNWVCAKSHKPELLLWLWPLLWE